MASLYLSLCHLKVYFINSSHAFLFFISAFYEIEWSVFKRHVILPFDFQMPTGYIVNISE